jgi:histidinol-phosphate aminotransferase
VKNKPVLNPFVAALPAYNAGITLSAARKSTGRDVFARLASNENCNGCSPRVLAALAQGFDPWRYADPACTELREAIAARFAVSTDCIVAGNGSEEMIAALSRAVLSPRDTVVTVVPSFGLHEIEPKACGAQVIKIPMTASFGFDVAAICSIMTELPKLVFLSSPWNPVGTALTGDEIAEIADALPPTAILVMDEAYVEFCGPNAPDTMSILRSKQRHFVILRTFSKAYGLAGLRVGYAIASDREIARVMTSAKTPFNVNAAAQIAALAALHDEEWLASSVRKIVQARHHVFAELTARGFSVAPSQANFLFIDIRRIAEDVAAELLQKGIIAKPWKEEGYRSFLRVSVGLPDENQTFLAAFLGADTAGAALSEQTVAAHIADVDHGLLNKEVHVDVVRGDPSVE